MYLFTVAVVLAAALIAQGDFITGLTIVVALVAPFILKLAPASWKGTGMAALAVALSLVLGVIDLWATGQLSNFNPATAGLTLAAYVGATQGIYTLFKGAFNLADPPAANPAPHTQIAAPPPGPAA